MRNKKEGKFVIKQLTKFSDLLEGKIEELPESDLCFQNEEGIAQFKYVESSEKQKKHTVKPGIYTLTSTSSGVIPAETELYKQDLLKDILNTTKITNEANTFFERLHIYEKLKRPKKRGVLLYSDPGMGKSAAISDFCTNAIKEDKGTVVYIWPTSKVDAEDVAHFLSVQSEFTKKSTRLILVIEDIGGNEHEGHGGPRGVDSGMLNLLDGLEVTFKLPTFIMATTNYPQNLLKELADRPRRFDLLIKLDPPTANERVKLAEFISKRPLDTLEVEALTHKRCNEFSIAHIEEMIIRSLLHDKTLMNVIDEIVNHKKAFAKDFIDDSGSMGFNR
jgi:SpoVK/Ycf46/Vps4 family AAA+-type ATPase